MKYLSIFLETPNVCANSVKKNQIFAKKNLVKQKNVYFGGKSRIQLLKSKLYPNK